MTPEAPLATASPPPLPDPPNATSHVPAPLPAKPRSRNNGNHRPSVIAQADRKRAVLDAATALLAGDSVRSAASSNNLTHWEGRTVANACQSPIEEFREKIRLIEQGALTLLSERLTADIAALEPMQAQIAWGIHTDKYRDLTGGNAPTVVHQTNIQVNGADRHTAMQLLKGAVKGIGKSLPEATQEV